MTFDPKAWTLSVALVLRTTVLALLIYATYKVIRLVHYEPRCEKTGLRGIPTRSLTNKAVQPQKMARGLNFRI